MTYDEIVLKMQSLRLDYLLGSLSAAVDTEAQALRKAEGERKQTQRFLSLTYQQAQFNLAEDITKFMTMGSGEITPDMIIANPRVAVAWAVSHKLKEDDLFCPVCHLKLGYNGDITIYDYVRKKYYLTKAYYCENSDTHDVYLVQQEVEHG